MSVHSVTLRRTPRRLPMAYTTWNDCRPTVSDTILWRDQIRENHLSLARSLAVACIWYLRCSRGTLKKDCTPFLPSISQRRRTLPWPPTPRQRWVCLARDSPQQPELYQVPIRSFGGIAGGNGNNAKVFGASAIRVYRQHLHGLGRVHTSGFL